jgi:hypothetical protein
VAKKAKKKTKKSLAKKKNPVERRLDGQARELRRLARQLKPEQRTFAELYVKDPDCFGNGAQAYAKAYNINLLLPGAYETACAAASRLLRFVKVCDYIRAMLDASSLNELNADRNLAFCLNQFDDLHVKLGALREYNKIKGRITAKHHVTGAILQPVMFGTGRDSNVERGK